MMRRICLFFFHPSILISSSFFSSFIQFSFFFISAASPLSSLLSPTLLISNPFICPPPLFTSLFPPSSLFLLTPEKRPNSSVCPELTPRVSSTHTHRKLESSHAHTHTHPAPSSVTRCDSRLPFHPSACRGPPASPVNQHVTPSSAPWLLILISWLLISFTPRLLDSQVLWLPFSSRPRLLGSMSPRGPESLHSSSPRLLVPWFLEFFKDRGTSSP